MSNTETTHERYTNHTWAIDKLHMSNTQSTHVQYTNYTWTIHKPHMSNTQTTHEQYTNHTWTMHKPHMSNTQATHEQYTNYTWANSYINSWKIHNTHTTHEQTPTLTPGRRVWRYQRGNQNLYIEEEQTTQWPKEKVQKDKQRSTKHTLKTKDRVTRTPLKTRGELRCSGRVSSFCFTSGTRRVNLVTNPVISREWGKDWKVFTTSDTDTQYTNYTWANSYINSWKIHNTQTTHEQTPILTLGKYIIHKLHMSKLLY